MVAVRRSIRGRVFFAHSDIWRFRGIERLSDYLKIKRRSHQPDTGTDASPRRGWKRFWRFLTSDKGLTLILILVSVATLIVIILL